MLTLLRHPTYRKLFAAQILSLIGTGLTTMALGLLAYQLAAERAGLVLGTALFIKMVAYVGLAPLAQAAAARLPRKHMLVTLDLVRAAIVLLLPLVTQIWQIYVLIFALQAASAAFTPAFQATIPEVLPDEADYTRALSLSRLAYEMESLVSPLLAAALLTVIPFSGLFVGTALGFLASALLVMATRFATSHQAQGSFGQRATRGLRIYLATPRLRGLLALTFSAAAASSMVIVNSVVLVQDRLGRAETDVALAFAAFGAGSILSALALPRLLQTRADRPVMMTGALVMVVALALVAVLPMRWGVVLGLWLAMGLGYSAVLTPSGRLLRRSGQATDLPTLFAAQFALSHLCWLVAYPLAGWLGVAAGMRGAAAGLVVLSIAGIVAARRFWPGETGGDLPHAHPDLPADHPHLAQGEPHRHRVVIDEHHRHWPTRP